MQTGMGEKKNEKARQTAQRRLLPSRGHPRLQHSALQPDPTNADETIETPDHRSPSACMRLRPRAGPLSGASSQDWGARPGRTGGDEGSGAATEVRRVWAVHAFPARAHISSASHALPRQSGAAVCSAGACLRASSSQVQRARWSTRAGRGRRAASAGRMGGGVRATAGASSQHKRSRWRPVFGLQREVRRRGLDFLGPMLLSRRVSTLRRPPHRGARCHQPWV